ncbi:MAG: DUF1330 domain-containing protein [Candidatus Acidiferrum sp.]
MSAYMIVNVDVRDPAAYEEYKNKVPALIRKYGGEYLVRGGKCVVMEGGWNPARLVLLKFPDLASAQAFFLDPEYQPLKAVRQQVSTADIVAVEGLI